MDLQISPQFSNCISYFSKIILSELKDIECWVAGGAVRDYFSIGYSNTDIDLFFPNVKEFNKAKNYFIYGNEEEPPIAKKLFENDNVLKILYKNRKLDLVKHFFKTPQKSIANFDFTVSCAAVNREGVYYHDTFFIDLAKKALVINKITYPLSTLQRLQRYIQKGFKICNGGILQLAEAIRQIENIDENHIEELEFYPDGTPKFRSID